VSPRKGEYFHALIRPLLVQKADVEFRFGWVNASYIYGTQIVNGHMRRALGTLTPYETFVKAVQESHAKAVADLA